MKKLLGIVVLLSFWCNVGYSENLPDTSPENQYKFATVYLEVGDWNNAERAFKEFVEKNPNHELAGNAQYWYAETFRFRKLYTKAASAYLENHKKYPKNEKAPINIIKLGISLIQLGEKEQGCLLITGVKKLFPKTSEKIKLKANYEAKKFSCKGISVNEVVDTIPNISKDLATEALLKVKKVKIKKTSKNWQPSLRGECDPSKNISPSLKHLTKNLASVKIDPSLTDPFSPAVTVLEPSIIFKDGTFTLLKRSNKKMTVRKASSRTYWVHELNQTINKKPQLYDDGTHGDLIAGDGVYTRSCLSLPINEINDKIYQEGHHMYFLDSSLRNTETVTQITKDVSINDTGFFITVGDDYRKINENGLLVNKTKSSKAMQAVWKAKGSIFDVFLMSPRNVISGGGGMYRVHDFIQGLGHNPRCENYSHCYDFVDGLKHPELIAVISGGNPLMGGSTLTHELEHAMFGINSGDDFPMGNDDPSHDKKFLLTNEWSVDGMHIEADVNVNTLLKGPLWDPARGYPYPVNLKVDGKEVETHFVKYGQGFKLRERTDKDYQLSDIFLYMLGFIKPEQAKEKYYKLVNYRLHGCKTTEHNLVCTNNRITFDKVIEFTTQDFINKFGRYSNPRSNLGTKSFDPKKIKLGILNYSDRKHTEAEITLKSMHYRSYAKGKGPTIKYKGQVYDKGAYIWSYVTKGKSNVKIDFTKN